MNKLKAYDEITQGHNEKFKVRLIHQFKLDVQDYKNANKELFLVNNEDYTFIIEKNHNDFHFDLKVLFDNFKVNRV